MSQLHEGNVATFTAGGAIAKNILVKLSSGVIAAAGLAEKAIGVTEAAAFASGDKVPVRLLSAAGTVQCTAGAAVTQGAIVYGRASGKIDDLGTSSAIAVGVALEAATADGDIIEVVPA